MSNATDPSNIPFGTNEFLTVRDVKNYLQISQSAAYGLTHSKEFPVSHFGSSIRIPKNAFLAWVAMQTMIPEALASDARGGV
jgi:excisionase family DNA binding protein